MRKHLKWASLVIYCSFVLSILSTAASATQCGIWGYFSVNGYNYQSRNTVTRLSSSMTQITLEIGPSGNQTIPAYYLRGQSTMWDCSTGKMIAQTGLTTNMSSIKPGTTALWGFSGTVGSNYKSIFSHGGHFAYNSSNGSWVGYGSYKSPCV
jgi:hypothetical protein